MKRGAGRHVGRGWSWVSGQFKPLVLDDSAVPANYPSSRTGFVPSTTSPSVRLLLAHVSLLLLAHALWRKPQQTSDESPCYCPWQDF